MKRSGWLIIVLVLAGCTGSKGFDHAALREALRQDSFTLSNSPNQIEPQSAARPALPAKLALYLKPTRVLNRRFEWTDADKDTFRTWASDLKSRGLLSDLYVVAESSVTGTQNSREVAARYGAEVLLIVEGATDLDRYNNYKGPLLYWTILGAYLAAGTHSDALCLVTASLWDVRAGARYFTVESEGQAKAVGPAAFLDDKDAIDRAKQAAIGDLQRKLSERLRSASENP